MTPYITPDQLRLAPLGIAWDTIPNILSATDNDAVLWTVCWQATAAADLFCEQVLRAVTNTEVQEGPGETITIQRNGNARWPLGRWPILWIVSASRLAATDFTSTDAQVIPRTSVRVKNPAILGYGTSAPDYAVGEFARVAEIQAGYVDWSQGRDGWQLTMTYVNGWPIAGLTGTTGGSIDAGVTTLPVDDCTGMFNPYTSLGATMRVGQGSNTEYVQCVGASIQSGPGTITLGAETIFPHFVGDMITAMPPTIQEAVGYYAAGIALERGAQAISAPQMPASVVKAGDASGFKDEAELILARFARTAW